MSEVEQFVEMPRIGSKPVPSYSPREDYMFGLSAVVGALAQVLVFRGVVTAPELQGFMEKLAAELRPEHGDSGALAAQTLGETAALWAKPKALAFPKDAQVVEFRRPEKDDDKGEPS